MAGAGGEAEGLAYDGPLEGGIPFCQSGTPGCDADADYDYASRPQGVKDAVGRVALTGRIGKPMLTLHGTLDSLLPIRTDSDVYTRMIRDAGRGSLHRYYVIEGRRTRIRFRVTSRGRPVRGAKVRFAGKTKRTGRRGRAVMVRRVFRPGLRRAVARKRGKRSAAVRVRVLRRHAGA